ncbi:MAG: ATP-binding protein [Gemmatimonadota bacterium]|nr:ATP-binding protein [Gemmatimonadota bacterium]
MSMSPVQIDAWLALPSEHEHLEFKLAATSFPMDRLLDYCVAIANEGGGHIVLGVTDALPRRVLGTLAFPNVQETKERLFEILRRRIEVDAVDHPNGRVLVFTIPSRPRGEALHRDGRYLMRVGQDLVPMSFDRLQAIAAEAQVDPSAHLVEGASVNDLDGGMIAHFRAQWIRKSGNAALAAATDAQLLADAGLLLDGAVTIGALVLFGTEASNRRFLPQAEVIFEYRSSEGEISYQQRVAFCSGFFGFGDELWRLIDSRNDRQSYQDGLFRYEIRTFDEGAVREAILNAVSHRDYANGGSVFVRQYPRRLSVVSPGGLPSGITPANVLDRQFPRNRSIAHALELCGLVERSGQGMNRMFERSITQGKPIPDFADTDAFQVGINLHGDLKHPSFVRYLEKLGSERVESFTTQDLLVLDFAQRGATVSDELRPRVERLLDIGAVERLGRRLILSRDLYAGMGQLGVYTRRKGLAHDAQKEILLQHIRENAVLGSPLSELVQVLPSVSDRSVKRLLQELKVEGKILPVGQRRWARWRPVQSE